MKQVVNIAYQPNQSGSLLPEVVSLLYISGGRMQRFTYGLITIMTMISGPTLQLSAASLPMITPFRILPVTCGSGFRTAGIRLTMAHQQMEVPGSQTAPKVKTPRPGAVVDGMPVFPESAPPSEARVRKMTEVIFTDSGLLMTI